MADYSITMNPNGKILDASAAVLERFKNDVEGLVGGSIKDLTVLGTTITDLDAYTSLCAVRPTCRLTSNINDNLSIEWELVANIGNSREVTSINATGRFVSHYPISRDALLACIEASGDGIMVTDPYGVILYANEAISRLTGYSKEELIGNKPNILRSENQDPALFQDLWDTIVDGQVWRGLVTNRRKDGKDYSEQQTITPVVSAYGDIQYFVANKRNVAP